MPVHSAISLRLTRRQGAHRTIVGRRKYHDSSTGLSYWRWVAKCEGCRYDLPVPTWRGAFDSAFLHARNWSRLNSRRET